MIYDVLLDVRINKIFYNRFYIMNIQNVPGQQHLHVIYYALFVLFRAVSYLASLRGAFSLDSKTKTTGRYVKRLRRWLVWLSTNTVFSFKFP